MGSVKNVGNGKNATEYVYVTETLVFALAKALGDVIPTKAKGRTEGSGIMIRSLGYARDDREEKMTAQPIEITDKAEAQILKLLDDAPDGTQGLRLTVKPTGCSGNSYAMEFIGADENLATDDKFESTNTALYIPKVHSWMLFGMSVDYIVDELGNARFDFANPNESGRCGCGESFHVDVDELQKMQETAD